MVKLPRAEQRSIYTPADMPHLAGDGWTAPARAMQGLGKAIGGLGSALADAQDQVDPRQLQEAKLAQLQFINDWNQKEMDFRASYAGDGKDYGASRSSLFEQESQAFMQQWPEPVQRRLAIPQERFRGSVQQDTYGFGYTRYNDTLYSNTGRAITGEMGRFATYVEDEERLNAYRQSPEQFSADLDSHIQSVDSLINSMPLAETRKDQLRVQAAQQIETLLGKMPAGVSLGTVRQQIERFSAPRGDIPGDMGSGAAAPAQPDRSSAVSPTGLGVVSARYESGSRGVGFISSGKGDPGGQSYGVHQLSGAYSMGAFLRSKEGAPYRERFGSAQPQSAEFNRVYRQIAADDPQGFAAAQHAFYSRTHYEPVRAHAERLGFDVKDRGVQEALFSMGVQHGGAKTIVSRAAEAGAAKGTPQEQITALYEQRTRYVSGLTSLPERTKQSVLNRYRREVDDALRLAGQAASGAAENDNEPTRVASLGATANDATATDAPASTVRTSSGNVRVAAEGAPTQGANAFRGSVANHLAERLITQLPAIEKKHRAEVAAQVKTVADRAARGEIIPADEERAIRTELGRLNDDQITTAFEMALAAARTTAQFKQLPPAALETLTLQMRARATAEGTSAAMSAQLAAMGQLHDTMVKELKADPLGWAVEAGVLPGPPSQEFTPEALAERAMAANIVAQHYGPQFFQAFSPNERDQLAEVLNQGGPQAALMLTAITQAFGQDAPRVMKEFAKDAPEAALLGWLIHAGGDSATIKDATDALALRRSEGFKSIAPNAVVARKTAIEVVGSAFQELPKNEQFATDLANLLYEVRARRAGLSEFDPELWKKGFNEALGANTDPATGITYGGIAYNDPNWLFAGGSDPFIAPANVDAARVRELLDTVRITDLVEGGMPVDVEAPETDVETTAAAVGVQGFANIPALTALQQKGLPVDDKGRPVSIATLRRARLVTVGDGRYFLAMGSDEDPRYIRTPTGENYVLDLKALEPVLSERRPDLYRLR